MGGGNGLPLLPCLRSCVVGISDVCDSPLSLFVGTALRAAYSIAVGVPGAHGTPVSVEGRLHATCVRATQAYAMYTKSTADMDYD